MVLAQMANIYLPAMRLSADLYSLEDIAQIDVAERPVSRMMRTFAVQMDALARYRAGGQRPIQVQNVSINNLSRTVAGNVSQNQTAHDTPGKSADASVSALTDIKAAPMPPLDESTGRAAIPERFQRYRPKLIK
jgi:hypothetical protein